MKYYDKLSAPESVAKWLLASLPKRGLEKPFHNDLLGVNGPKWLAQQAISDGREFDNQTRSVGLHEYAEGRYLTIAKQIYFVEQLRSIPCNKPHCILSELQNQDTFESRYDEHHLLGHKVLEILIERAPTTEIHDSWRNVVLAIGGDPRVPEHHPKYRKWWSQIDLNLIEKVRGWLSGLDLRLFLEAMKNYSYLSGNFELKRMFPSRKRFLEGMFNKGLITNTRLYLSSKAEQYMRKNYKPEHLPRFSNVDNGDQSLIHVRVGDSHMIEGSHSCYLWIYERLSPSSIVFNYSKTKVSYKSLTQGMSKKMKL